MTHRTAARLLTFLALFAAASARAAAEEVAPDDPRLVAVRARLEAERDRTGAAPTVESFYAAVRAAGIGAPDRPAPTELIDAAWLALRSMQKPAVSPERIAELARKRRDALTTVRIRYRTERTGRELTPDWPDRVARECRFVRSGDKLYYRERSGGRPDALEEEELAAYDGKVLRTGRGRIGDRGDGSIRTLDDTSRLIDDDGPLVLARCLDAGLLRKGGTSPDDVDLTRAIGDGSRLLVQERPVTVNGRECLLATGPLGGPRFFFDPSVGCGLVRFETDYYDTVEEADGRRRLVADGGVQVNFSDYRAVGDVWLPFRVERTTTLKGAIDRCVVTVESCEVGGEIPGATFVAVFPEGWTVEDQVRKGYVSIGRGGTQADFQPF